jgi:hypothetical protein
MQKRDLTGQTFGRLTVIGPAPRQNGQTMWLCRCTCSQTIAVSKKSLLRGWKTNCGCKGNPGVNHSDPTWQKFIRYQHGARARGLPFDLTLEQFTTIVGQPCTYCGTPNCGGVDRIDNQQGYTTENSTPCCGPCNWMKGALTAHEFVEQCKRVAEWQGVL